MSIELKKKESAKKEVIHDNEDDNHQLLMLARPRKPTSEEEITRNSIHKKSKRNEYSKYSHKDKAWGEVDLAEFDRKNVFS